MTVIDDIKAKLDIVDVVSGYIQLQKAGRNFKAPCPFHTEKTPSFIVNPERQSWHCFGACATGGDIFSFVMRQEKTDFGQTLRLLAKRAGVELTPRGQPGKSDALYRVNEAAAAYYQKVLESSSGAAARRYLDERGVNGEMRSVFKLGLSPDSRDALKTYLTDQGFEMDVAVQSGLVIRADDGHTREFFWGRLMFPICDRQGRVAGFGGRTLSGGEPKYINTAGTPVFDKRGTLYALHLAADSIRSRDTGVIVEGYMDAIAAHQHGFTNVVASMGTALTEAQVAQLKSLAGSFVLALDPDAAGQEATFRSLEASWHAIGRQDAAMTHRRVGALHRRDPVKLRIAALPPGQDPDVVVRRDPKEWERRIAEAVPLMDYLIPTVAARYDLATDDGKAQAVAVLAPLVTAPENPFEQGRYRDKLASVLHVSPEALTPILKQFQPSVQGRRERAGRRAGRETPATVLGIGSKASVEEYAIALMLHRPELKERALTFSPEFFHQSEDREVFTMWLACPTIDALKQSLDTSLQGHVDHLVGIELEPADRRESEAALEQCLWRLEVRHLQELQEGLLADSAGDALSRELEAAITPVNARLKELFGQRV
jgi:DNA primase